jgi:two-component system OmpR family response regulator
VRLLLVEDDATLAAQLRNAFGQAGFTVDHVPDGAEAAHLGAEERYAAVVLDLGLPRQDGLSVLRGWRAAGMTVPVLILTARDGFADKAAGFRAGADDFVVKPFRMEEVLLRLRALIRRASGHAAPVLQLGPIAHDTDAGTFTRDGLPLRLTAFEARVLSYLMHHPRRVISRTELSDVLYGADSDRDFNSLEVIVSRLRRKLTPISIETIRGQGWRLAVPESH